VVAAAVVTGGIAAGVRCVLKRSVFISTTISATSAAIATVTIPKMIRSPLVSGIPRE
jgi:hypothetical protein